MSKPGPDLLQDLEAEQATLGGLLFGGRGALDEVAPWVGAEDFGEQGHPYIYSAIEAVAQTGEDVNIVTVADEMRRRDTLGYLRFRGGEAYLAELSSGIGRIVDIRPGGIASCAKIVREKSQARAALREAQEAERLARRGDIEGVAKSATELKRIVKPPGKGRRKKPVQRKGRLFQRGSDVEIGRALLEDLQADHGQVVHSEGHFWRYEEPLGIWLAFEAPELERHLHEYDGAPKKDGKELSMGDGKVTGSLKRAAAEVASPRFFAEGAGVVFSNCSLIVTEER